MDGDIGWIIPLLSQRTVSAVPVFNQNLYILGSQLNKVFKFLLFNNDNGHGRGGFIESSAVQARKGGIS